MTGHPLRIRHIDRPVPEIPPKRVPHSASSPTIEPAVDRVPLSVPLGGTHF
jgi:hypothetical protein